VNRATQSPWADRSRRKAENHARIEVLLEEIRCLDFDLEAAAVYGRLRTSLEARSLPIGPNDTLIASQALALGLVLVTDNVEEFRRIDGLQMENWRNR
jgi:tRNA(fMet)-specific endonuclease VapC